MRRWYGEQVILLTGMVKWLIISVIIGVITGFSTAGFLALLEFSVERTARYRWYFLSLPLALFIAKFLIHTCAREAEGYGTETVIRAIHMHSGRMSIKVIPIKILATVITIASGGSAGKWGPSVQVGSVLASQAASIFRLNDEDMKRAVICGISGAFAAVFGTPVAGAIFAVEVLFLGKIMYATVFPALITAYISFEVASAAGMIYEQVLVQIPAGIDLLLYSKAVLAGILFGFVALILISAMKKSFSFFAALSIYPPLKAAIGGLVVVACALIFSPMYIGLGSSAITGYLSGYIGEPHGFLVKIAATAVTLGSGGSGGIVTPIVFIGTSFGSFLGSILQEDTVLFAALGMVSVLSGAANTPIACIFFAAELFGLAAAPLAAVSCVASYLVTGHRGVFTSQVLALSKSPSLDVPYGVEIEEADTKYKNREHTLAAYICRKMKNMQKN